MAAGDEDVGEALVVAQQHIVARLQLLDEIGLQQQRLGLGLGGDEDHRHGLRDHPGDADGLALRRRIALDALLDRARLADIEHLAVGADHAVDAGAERRVLPERLDRRRAARQRARLGLRLVEVEIERRGSLVGLFLERGGGEFGFAGWRRLGRAGHGSDLGREGRFAKGAAVDAGAERVRREAPCLRRIAAAERGAADDRFAIA
jgi:hypothetical protein